MKKLFSRTSTNKNLIFFAGGPDNENFGQRAKGPKSGFSIPEEKTPEAQSAEAKKTIKKNSRGLNDSIKKIPLPKSIKAGTHNRLQSKILKNMENGSLDVSSIEHDLKEAFRQKPEGKDEMGGHHTEIKLGNARVEQEKQQEAQKKELSNYLKQIQKALIENAKQLKKQAKDSGNNELLKEAKDLEKRGKIMGALSQRVQNGTFDPNIPNPGQETASGLGEKCIQTAKQYMGISEGEANKKWSGGKDQPWCADFINGVIKEAGGKGSGSSMAKSFAGCGSSGKGHVGFYVNGQILGGNQGDTVCMKPMKGTPIAHADPSNPMQPSSGELKNGDICVFNRGGKGGGGVGTKVA